MADRSLLNLEELRRLYAFANTPAYLFRRFRRDESVKRLADAVSLPELVSEIKEVDGNPERSLDDVVSAYAALVAATHKNPARTRPALESLVVSNLDWIGSIIELWAATLISTDKHIMTMKPTLVAPEAISRSTTSTTASKIPTPNDDG